MLWCTKKKCPDGKARAVHTRKPIDDLFDLRAPTALRRDASGNHGEGVAIDDWRGINADVSDSLKADRAIERARVHTRKIPF